MANKCTTWLPRAETKGSSCSWAGNSPIYNPAVTQEFVLLHLFLYTENLVIHTFCLSLTYCLLSSVSDVAVHILWHLPQRLSKSWSSFHAFSCDRIIINAGTYILHVDVRFRTGLHEFDTVLQCQLTAAEKTQNQCQCSDIITPDDKYTAHKNKYSPRLFSRKIDWKTHTHDTHKGNLKWPTYACFWL